MGALRAPERRPVEVDLIAAELPAAAEEIVRGKAWDYQQADRFWHYTEFTTAEARALAAALANAGFEQDEQANSSQLEYHFAYRDPDLETVVHIEFRPLLPHEVD